MIRYIGQSCTGMRRPRSHRWTTAKLNTHCGRWLRKLFDAGYNYKIAVLDTADNAAQLNSLERWWIAYGKLFWPLTNTAPGGEGGSSPGAMSEKGRHNMRVKNKARWTDDKRLAMSGDNNWMRQPGNKARHPGSPSVRKEVAEKISAALKGRPSPIKGKPKSPEARRNMSIAQKARPPRSASHCAALSKAMTGKKASPEAKAKMRARAYMPCGTVAAYSRAIKRRRRGDDHCGPCNACRDASRTAAAERYARSKC